MQRCSCNGVPCVHTLQDVLAAAEARVDELRERLEDERQEVAASSATLAAATELAQARLQLAFALHALPVALCMIF